MEFGQKAQSQLKSLIKKSLDMYILDMDSTSIITDIHLQPLQETGELVIYNDDEELVRGTVKAFSECKDDDFYSEAESVLRNALQSLRGEAFFKQLIISKPYGFVMIDEDKETLAELLIVDDEETLLLGDPLLKGLDKELDDFLDQLIQM